MEVALLLVLLKEERGIFEKKNEDKIENKNKVN